MSKDTQLDMVREAANRPPYKQDVYVNAGQLLEEIEREYLPRPRFEDGEPVKEGDTICIDGHLPLKVNSWSIRNDGLTVFSCPTSHRSIKTGDCVKRPEPEVLDADGVPIRIGDTVWNVNTGKCLVVKGFSERWFLAIEDTIKHNPLAFSHKEPDSLERIEADAKLDVCVYYEGRDEHKCDGCRGAYCFECKHEMMLDLLRRQREVLERDHER